MYIGVCVVRALGFQTEKSITFMCNQCAVKDLDMFEIFSGCSSLTESFRGGLTWDIGQSMIEIYIYIYTVYLIDRSIYRSI